MKDGNIFKNELTKKLILLVLFNDDEFYLSNKTLSIFIKVLIYVYKTF